MEKRLLREFEIMLDTIAQRLTAQNHASAVALAELPSMVRGFGHVKAASAQRYEAEMARLRPAFETGHKVPTVLRHAHP